MPGGRRRPKVSRHVAGVCPDELSPLSPVVVVGGREVRVHHGDGHKGSNSRIRIVYATMQWVYTRKLSISINSCNAGC